MPQLPDLNALGARPVASGASPVVDPGDTGAGGRALQRTGDLLVRSGRAAIGREQEVVENIRRQKIEAAALEYKRKQNDWLIENVYSPETGLEAKKGSAAAGLTKSLVEKFQEASAEWGENLPPEAAQAAGAWAESGRAEVARLAATHESRERLAHLNGIADASLQSAVQMAAVAQGDPQKVDEQIALADRVIESTGARVHWAPEEVQARKYAKRAEIRGAVLDGFFSRNATYQDGIAYFEAHKDELGDRQDEYSAQAHKASVFVRSMAEFDRIKDTIGSGPEGMAAARKLDDPEVRMAVEERLRIDRASLAQELQLREHDTREYGKSLVFNVPIGTTYDDLPPAARQRIETVPGLREDLSDELKRRLTQTARASDPKVKEELRLEAFKSPLTFMQRDLSKEQFKLSESDYTDLVHLQQQLKDPKVQANFATESQLLNIAYGRLRIDGTKQTKRRDLFNEQYVAAKKSFVASNKREPNADEMEKMMRALELPFVRDGFFGDETKPAFLIKPAEAKDFQVPAADRQQIIEAYRQLGRPEPTEEQIRRAYLRQAMDQAQP